MKRILSILLAAMILCSAFTAVAANDKISATFLYVATDGSDGANGSAEAPFATIEKAVEAARSIDGTVVINLRGGTYTVKDTITLTAADSDLVIRGAVGEKAVITAGTDIPYSAFSKVTDEAFLSALTTPSAKGKIVSANLKDLGITDYGFIGKNGFEIKSFVDGFGYASTLSHNGQQLTIARYPNEGYIYTGEVIREGGENAEGGFFNDKELVQVEFRSDDKRYKKWTSNDIWMSGWLRWDWFDSTFPIEINKEKDSIITYAMYMQPIEANSRFYFFNVPEEMDVPGEWYINRETGVLYLYPTDDMKAGDNLIFNSSNKKFFDISGVKNVTIENLAMTGTCSNAVTCKDSVNFVINSCEISSIGDTAIYLTNCTNSGVENSFIHDLGSQAIYIYACGDKENLVSGNCFIRNNEISDFAQYKKTALGIRNLDNVGLVISNNKIHDGSHIAIRYEDNDCIIEYNDIYNVCTDSSDSGAIYTGRRFETWGNEIRYNYIHDLEMIYTTKGMEMQAVYLDDMSQSTNVHGNVFYNVDSVALMGGGRYNKFCNNIMVDCRKPLVFDARAVNMGWSVDDCVKTLKNYPYNTGVWAEKYPELSNVLEDEPEVPKHNVLTGNVSYNSPEFSIDSVVEQNSTIENNIEITKSTEFVDYRNKNFALKEDSSVFTKLPDFENIPFDKIGLQEYTYEEKYVDAGTELPTPVAPVENEIKVIVNDKNVEFDVAPTIINDRTMVPLRAIFEALGADVDWDDATKTITAVKGDTTITMQIGNTVMTKNGEKITLDSEPTIIDSRTLVPVRAIAESFGSDVSWEAETKTVIIKDLEPVEDAADDKAEEIKDEEESSDAAGETKESEEIKETETEK